MAKRIKRTIYANDATESVGLLIRLRLPWLLAGLVAGSITTLAVSKFEHVLASEVRLAFFIPLIVYLSDAVGTQTETIFVRNASKRNLSMHSFLRMLTKELSIGLILGVIFGVLSAAFAYWWLGSAAVAITVGTAMALSISSATVIAIIAPAILKRGHQDPAIGSGPFTTVIQDFVSLMIYFLIAATIIL